MLAPPISWFRSPVNWTMSMGSGSSPGATSAGDATGLRGTAPSGACCGASDTAGCVELTESECVEQGGAYLGDGSICGMDACNSGARGACCLADGAFDCVQATEDFCLQVGGTFLGAGVVCDNIICPFPEEPVACCLLDGSCAELSDVDCAALGGFAGGADSLCATFDCDAPRLGGCCVPIDGSDLTMCEIVTESECEERGGFYLGDDQFCQAGEFCNVIPAFGACCLPDGSCEQMLISRCRDLGGVDGGLDSTCGEVACPSGDGFGACCMSGGSCIAVSASDCAAFDGEFLGDGTTCDNVICEAP